jgi:glycerol-3-phosphate acyltransferase PlsY
MKPALLLVISYLLGSVSFGYWIVFAFRGLDIRTLGSGNAGATNALRTAGKVPALLTLVGDLAKGILPVVVARWMEFAPPWAALAGASAVLGHVYPVFHGLRGGKGVSTAAGTFVALAPVPALTTFVSFFVIVRISRYVSLGSIVAAVAFPVLWHLAGERGLARPPVRDELLTVAGLALLIVWRHRGNLQRLVRGIERRLGEVLDVGGEGRAE